ncbi:hypothetical protein PGT21_008664 [Puccinia graminis f. sp. tritici]|uniref:Uncharacterized protein n=1 Tax=Puccinia graminis f. sp. tritici TaxID=56615 RepID=A0A5B0QEZ2_PUCGR|nr:hypothetical protein PGT21_008664 [Puccinia graminis f. sp. tritici]
MSCARLLDIRSPSLPTIRCRSSCKTGDCWRNSRPRVTASATYLNSRCSAGRGLRHNRLDERIPVKLLLHTPDAVIGRQTTVQGHCHATALPRNDIYSLLIMYGFRTIKV